MHISYKMKNYLSIIINKCYLKPRKYLFLFSVFFCTEQQKGQDKAAEKTRYDMLDCTCNLLVHGEKKYSCIMCSLVKA